MDMTPNEVREAQRAFVAIATAMGMGQRDTAQRCCEELEMEGRRATTIARLGAVIAAYADMVQLARGNPEFDAWVRQYLSSMVALTEELE